MPIVETGVTSEDITRETRKKGLAQKTWKRLQEAEDSKEAYDVAYSHIDRLQEGIEEQIEFEVFDGPSEKEKEMGREIQQIDVYVHLADFSEPVPLLYFEYDVKSKEAIGGDLELF
jgi:hypothetical protein